uniref:Uncharacterized protein n=1 Tax=Trichuris muris TaxID=70415 RepID=A0A5S6QEV1_TRIMR
MDKPLTSIDKTLEELRQFPVDSAKKEQVPDILSCEISQISRDHCEDFDITTPFGPYGIRGEGVHRAYDTVFVREQIPAEIAASEQNKSRLILVDDNKPHVLQLVRVIKYERGPPVVNDLDQQPAETVLPAEKEERHPSITIAEKPAPRLNTPAEISTSDIPSLERSKRLSRKRLSKRKSKSKRTVPVDGKAAETPRKPSTPGKSAKGEQRKRATSGSTKCITGDLDDDDDEDEDDTETDAESMGPSPSSKVPCSTTPKAEPAKKSDKVSRSSAPSVKTARTKASKGKLLDLRERLRQFKRKRKGKSPKK